MWYGSHLSKIENLTIRSYLANGYSFTLYVYDMGITVPNGTILRDAREILSEDKIYGENGFWQPFSDMFRYKLLMETDHTWVDMDAICLRDDWNFGDYIIGLEEDHEYISKVNNAIFKLPSDSESLKYMYEYCLNIDKSLINWNPSIPGPPIDLGPVLLEHTVEKFNLEKYLQTEHTFYPINWQYGHMYFHPDPKVREKIKNISKNSYTAHITTSIAGFRINKNFFPEGSFIDYLDKKYRKGI
jgi:hypothetical protein